MRTTRQHGRPTRFTVGPRTADVVEVARTLDAAGTAEPATTWSDARLLSDALHRALDRGAGRIVVDLEGADHASTSLLAVLIAARRRARARGAVLVVRGSPALRRLARVCRVERVAGVG